MLSSITRLYKNQSNPLQFGAIQESQRELSVFENIDKHLPVLYYRNSQLRNAILAKSEKDVIKRKAQFIAVLHSYVRLIVVNLHGPIDQTNHFGDTSKYTAIRSKTFSEYEKMIARSNITCAEMMKPGSDFSRELFQMELKIKEFQTIEEESIYPLHKEARKQH